MIKNRTALARAIVLVVFTFVAAELHAQYPPPPHRGGVTLFENADFRGRSETFYGDVPYLSNTVVGSDRASSVRVDRGCVVTLYERPYYGGLSTVLRDDLDDLSYSRVGNDEVSSLRVDCRGYAGPNPDPPGWVQSPRPPRWDERRGVILFEDDDFRGDATLFNRDSPDLRREPIGNDRASSVRVAPGCEAILYADTDYRGRSTLVRGDVESLRYTVVGNDTVSSIAVRCRAYGGPNPVPDWGRRPGVALYEDVDFSGRYEILYDDDRNLSSNAIGNDEVSSIRIAPGCEAALYEHSDFRGNSVVVRGDIEDMRATRLGNDQLSSIRIRCRGRRF